MKNFEVELLSCGPHGAQAENICEWWFKELEEAVRAVDGLNWQQRQENVDGILILWDRRKKRPTDSTMMMYLLFKH